MTKTGKIFAIVAICLGIAIAVSSYYKGGAQRAGKNIDTAVQGTKDVAKDVKDAATDLKDKISNK